MDANGVMSGCCVARLRETVAHAGALMQESCHATLRGSAWAVMGSAGSCARAHGMQEGLPTFPSLATVCIVLVDGLIALFSS